MNRDEIDAKKEAFRRRGNIHTILQSIFTIAMGTLPTYFYSEGHPAEAFVMGSSLLMAKTLFYVAGKLQRKLNHDRAYDFAWYQRRGNIGCGRNTEGEEWKRGTDYPLSDTDY